MKAPRAPHLDERRTEEFSAELGDRAQAWIPLWALADSERDFGRALLQVAARFSSEVAERLDRAGDKMRRGFLDWLGVPRKAARPARVPVVFKLADSAQEAVLATAPVQMQADAGGTPVVFETEQDLRIVPGRLGIVIGVDAAEDAFYLPPPGLADLQPLVPQPTQWQLKSFAAAGATKLQLDPATGLTVDMIIAAGGAQYLITEPKPDNGIVTIDPPLDSELPESTVITRVANFAPFEGAARNRQEHALYLGHMELLNIEAAATIDVVGANSLATGIKWQYWGKVKGSDQPAWQPLNIAPVEDQKADALVLMKSEGSVDPKKIGEINSRWIRASATKVEGETPLLQVDELQIRINCKKDFPACPKPADQDEPSPAAEAMANTTPLVLVDFFPFGKEPRQFDAFYLGSQEAFSKDGAEVQLCFEIAEPSFAALSNLRAGAQPIEFLAGVAGDGHLHLLQFNPASASLSSYPNHGPLQPPSPEPGGVAVEGPPVALDPRPPYRIPIWTVGTSIFMAVSAKNAVWIWREDIGNPGSSGWESAGLVEDVADSSAPIAALVYLDDTPAGQLFALRDSTLFVRNLSDSNATWKNVTTRTPGNNQVKLATIAPILIEGVDLRGGSVSKGLVGVDRDNKLYGISLQNNLVEGICTELLTDISPDVTPIAVRSVRLGNQLIAVAVRKNQSNRKLLAFLSTASTFTEAARDEVDLNAVGIVGQSIDVNLTGGHLTFVANIKPNEESTALVAWSPFDPDPHAVLFTTKFPPYVDTPAGAPTLLSRHVIVPTVSSQVIVAPFDASGTGRLRFQTKLETALVTSATTDQLAVGDQIAIPVSQAVPTHVLKPVAAGVDHGGETVYEFDVQSIDDKVFVYPAAATPFKGSTVPNALGKLKIDTTDNITAKHAVLLVTTDASSELYFVTSFNGATKRATLDRALNVNNPAAPPATVDYQVSDSTTAKLLPLMRLNPATNGNWDASLLDRTQLVFPSADPALQSGIVFQLDPMGRPILIVLSQHWVIVPPDVGGGDAEFIVDNSVGAWIAQLGNAFTNPELSWEYWNGRGWWKLEDLRDDTQNLKTTGTLRFKVPSDIASSDWAGKTNFWIRARLVGGDYGREKITAKSKTVGNTTEQTIERSTDGIRAPEILHLEISYRVCKPVLPTVVLTDDSGSRIDQSDANRTGSAIVEAFVPLSLTLARLSSAKSSAETTSDCPPDYDCQKALKPAATVPTASTATPANPETPASQRSLFVGLAATPSEAPVNVLLLVEERDHTNFAPLTIEALVANRFEKIVSNDATRALGESGLLTMTFAIPPTPSDLFGQSGLTWLRLTPEASASGEWKPVLRGAYLNAVWASATETLTRELLGSSDGAPNMVVRLARPPVLDATLELRVKEPLDEQERAQFLKANPASVVTEVSAIDGRTSDWVVWKQVVDPNYEPPDARVYSLDESKGEIRFGDGQHGLIPPIGRDSIVAIKYKRTEPGSTTNNTVPGNLVTSRTALNLVSPVATVESVIAADQAAGGAPPEDDDRVLRFGYSRLRHRDRAITLLDLEDLTAESSPDIAQAHAIARQGSVRLVVLMRGKNPTPNAAQRRELRRYLLDKAPISLGMPNALRITGPHIRRLRLDLTLRVTSLDKAGSVGNWVKEKLEHFFDTSTGGIDGDGWLLGANPLEDDVTFALLDAPDLESIKSVKRYEIADDGSEELWSALLKPTELAMLDEDPLRIHFETVEEPI